MRMAAFLLLAVAMTLMGNAAQADTLTVRLASIGGRDGADPQLGDVSYVFEHMRITSYRLVATRTVNLPTRAANLALASGISVEVEGDSNDLSLSATEGGRTLFSTRAPLGGRPLSYNLRTGGGEFVLVLTLR